MSLLMPKPEEAILSKRKDLVQRLRGIVPFDSVIDEETELRAYPDLFAILVPLPARNIEMPEGRDRSGTDFRQRLCFSNG